MKLFPFSAVAASILLTGCLDSDDTPALTGVLPIPAISGLSFETETQSGSLSSSQYNYLEGETVSIKLGSQVLLTFDAEQDPSLDSMISQWPENEDELQSAYFDEDVFQDFQLAANFMQLVYNLDADGDAENGFDLTAYEDISDSISLDLSISPNAFYETELLALAASINSQRTVTPMTSIGDLFTLSGQSITYEQQIQQTTDSDNNGSIDQVKDYEYNDNGLVIVNKTDSNMDTISDRITENSYTLSGLYSGYNYISDTDNDGFANRSNHEEKTYNNLNLVEQKTFGSDYYGDGSDNYVTKNVYTYDDLGRVITDEYSSDNDGDSIYDSISTSDYTYNESSAVTSIVFQEDQGVNGSIDVIQTHAYTYNEQGLLTEHVRSDDDNADGTEEDRVAINYTYDDAGNTLTEFQGNYENDVLGFSTLQTFEYNDSGEITENQLISDYTGDGQTNYIFTVTYAYDEFGNRASQLQLTYQDGSTLSKQINYTYEYDIQNNKTLENKEEDEDLNGSYDTTEKRVYTYTEAGNVASQIVTDDEDNDGTAETTSEYLYTYTQNVNGHKTLLAEYEAYFD